jgi:hypothetical protein
MSDRLGRPLAGHSPARRPDASGLRDGPQRRVYEVGQVVRGDGVDAGPPAAAAVRGVERVGKGEGLREAVRR